MKSATQWSIEFIKHQMLSWSINNHVVLTRFHNLSTFRGRGTDTLTHLPMMSLRLSTGEKSGECDGQGSFWWAYRDCVLMCAVCHHALSCWKTVVGIPWRYSSKTGHRTSSTYQCDTRVPLMQTRSVWLLMLMTAHIIIPCRKAVQLSSMVTV